MHLHVPQWRWRCCCVGWLQQQICPHAWVDLLFQRPCLLLVMVLFLLLLNVCFLVPTGTASAGLANHFT
jgi:hypothetical protein